MSYRTKGRLTGVVLSAALAGLLFLSLPRPVFAHALLVRSDPPSGTVLQDSPHQVRLWFTEDLNGTASSIVVWNRYRQVMSVGHARVVPGHPREMTVGLNALAPGSYLVLWTSVSAQDGHIWHGYFLFSVKVRGPGPSLTGVSNASSQVFPDTAGLISIVAHWVELLAAVVWTGSMAFAWLVLAPLASGLSLSQLEAASRRFTRLVSTSLIALLVASSVVIFILAYNLAQGVWSSVFATSTWSSLFAAQYGQLWIARQSIAVLSFAGCLLTLRRPLAASPSLAAASAKRSPLEESRRWALLGAGILYLYLFAASGHAAASAVLPLDDSRILSGSVFVDWLHFLADASWFGGQIYIALALIPALSPALKDSPSIRNFLAILNRFSPFAYASVATFTLSGIFNADVRTPSFYAFVNSIYGRTLMVKVTLVGFMMIVSAFTVFAVRPYLARLLGRGDFDPVPRLLRTLLVALRINPVLGAGVLLATSVMFYYPVPFGFSPGGPSAYIVHRAGLTATVRIQPDSSGPNTVTVALTGPNGKPVSQAHISVLTNMLDMVMGTGIASLDEKSSGQFAGTLDLAMGGRWRLIFLVYQPAGLTKMTVDIRVST